MGIVSQISAPSVFWYSAPRADRVQRASFFQPWAQNLAMTQCGGVRLRTRVHPFHCKCSALNPNSQRINIQTRFTRTCRVSLGQTSKLFVREATGLVRSMTTTDAFMLNMGVL